MTAASTRLSVMMFLEYLIWGSWLPLLALYLGDVLGFTGGADRLDFRDAGDRVRVRLCSSAARSPTACSRPRSCWRCCTLVGGAAMFALAFQKTFWPFFIVMLIYQLAYMPTMSLTNAICFHHISNAQTEFGKLRLWGTIGWIAASWPFVFILPARPARSFTPRSSSIFTVAGIASIALAGLLVDAAAHAAGASAKKAPARR